VLRVGLGLDVHPYEQSRPLILCGVRVSAEHGLLGHSDGDVATHALMDAILGASGLKDIGHFFPSTPEWKDASSLEMLKIVKGKMEKKGFQLINADISLMLESPKISPYCDEMIQNLKMIFPGAQFSIKATTCEGLGFIGKEEGAAAIAVVLLESIRHG